MTDQDLTHRLMVKQLEITSRNAANVVLREEMAELKKERDILEEGFRQAREEIIKLRARAERAEKALQEFQHDAEAVQAEPGE